MAEPIEDRLATLLTMVPDDYRWIVAEYAPVFLEWTTDEIWQWIHLLTTDYQAAYAQLLASKPGTELLNEWMTQNEDLAGLNSKHSARASIGKEAAAVICRAMLTAAVALVGL
jgi:hypothetical protein